MCWGMRTVLHPRLTSSVLEILWDCLGLDVSMGSSTTQSFTGLSVGLTCTLLALLHGSSLLQTLACKGSWVACRSAPSPCCTGCVIFSHCDIILGLSTLLCRSALII